MEKIAMGQKINKKNFYINDYTPKIFYFLSLYKIIQITYFG